MSTTNVRLPLLAKPAPPSSGAIAAIDGVQGLRGTHGATQGGLTSGSSEDRSSEASVPIPVSISTPVPADLGSIPNLAALSLDAMDAPADEKLLQVGDLARESGKTVRALHLYEELDLLRPAARSKGRYRLYSAEALVRIRWISKLQDMGFSLSDIQTVVKDWEKAQSAPHAMVKVREVYAKKLEETRATLRRLQALEHEIRASLAYLDTCDVCDPERLVTACKACELHDCQTAVPDLVAGFRASTV